jgi:hypothetical protein
MSSVPIPLVLIPQLQALAQARNGRSPDASFLNLMLSDTNYLSRWRTKELFRWGSPVVFPLSSSGNRTRWRFAAHLSPKARYVYVHMYLAAFSSTAGSDPYGKFTLLDSGGSTIGTAEVHFGENPLDGGSDVPSFFSGMFIALNDGTGPSGVVTVTPDSDVYGVFEDKNGARLLAADVYEYALDATVANGYLQSPYGVGSPIYSSVREGITTTLRTMWKRGAAHLFNLTVDVDSLALTRSSATAVNIVDLSSTTPSSSTPGLVLDLLQKGTVRRGAVPCVFAAYGRNGTSGGAGGKVDLVDSTNTIVATITFTNNSNAWVSTTVNLPATVAKYDIRFRGDGTFTFTLYSLSLYQHEA